MTEGSITSPLSAHSPCPVMVVPAEYGWAAGYRKPVVVALDAQQRPGQPSSSLSTRRRSDKWISRSCTHGQPGESAVAVNDDLVTLAEILAGWKADRPDVNVHTVILPGEPAEVIVDASTEAGRDGGRSSPSATSGLLDPIGGPRRTPSRALPSGDRPALSDAVADRARRRQRRVAGHHARRQRRQIDNTFRLVGEFGEQRGRRRICRLFTAGASICRLGPVRTLSKRRTDSIVGP